MEEIRVIINPDGSSSVEAKGIQGGACRMLTAPFTQGAEVIEDKTTNEYYQLPANQRQTNSR
jgi:hypothetical protein